MKHRLLARQLKNLGLAPDEAPDAAQWRTFCEKVEDAYRLADEERYRLERSLRLSSEEMRTLYDRVKSSSEARLRAIARAVPDMLFFQDEEGVYLEVLTARPEQLYVPPDKIVGRTPEELFDASHAERFMALLRRTLDSGREQLLEYWLDLPEGKRLFQARMVPVGYRVRGLRTVLTVVHDITGQRQEETWNRLVGQAVGSAREGIAILDKAQAPLFTNPAFEALVQSQTGELPGCIAGNERLWEQVEAHGSWREEVLVPGKPERWWWVRVDKVKLEADQQNYYVVLINDVTELHSSRRELEYLATHDPLTGLPNRILSRDRLEMAVAGARREGNLGALLFIDLDRFKGVNDALGHSMGDKLLLAVAERLQGAVREVDSLSRLGGDEFTLVVQDLCRQEQINPILEKLLAVFRNPFHLAGMEFHISASIGVSFFPEEGVDADQLLRRADAAMYSAKSAGGGRGHFFSSTVGVLSDRSFEIEQALRKALRDKEFHLAYQPQYLLASGELAGFEALLRWDSVKWGALGPAQFVPVAEASGFMEELGRWVLEEVCRQHAAWREEGLEIPRIAVNLSACELRQENLPGLVERLLTRYAMPADRLELEITESMIIGDETSYRILNGLHELGVGLAIDDFGTGHSTLVNLKRFPLDCLKIDASFVRDVGSDRNDEAIIEASVLLARSFGMRTVAEGVENDQQIAFLEHVGCDEVQGYHCGRPMTAEAVSQLAAASERGLACENCRRIR